jgi:alkylhydroperoxidase family enzyme
VTRLAVPEPGELRPDIEQLVAAIAPPGREPAKTMAVLGRQPDLLSPFLGWAAALALNGVLSNRAHELLALRAASNCRSDFEWVEHAEYARAAGLTDAEIDAAARPITNTRTTPSALAAADGIYATRRHRRHGVPDGSLRHTSSNPVRGWSVHAALDVRERRRDPSVATQCSFGRSATTSGLLRAPER